MNFIAFDFDGTIANSKFAICEAMERACIRRGLPYVGDEEFSQQIGRDLNECFHYATTAELDDEMVAKLGQSYRETFRFNMINMFDGMRRVLELCNDLGDKIAIASSRRSDSLTALINQFEIKDLITASIGGDKVKYPKPSAEMLWEVARELQCNPGELLVVGDTTWDMEMARNTGAFAIGVTWGSHDEVQLRGAGADVICDSPRALGNHFNFATI